MYEPLDRWSPRLRQGDILGPADVPMVGQRDAKVVARLTDLMSGASTAPTSWQYPVKPGQYLMVLSHDCEFNDDKRDRLLVARMQAARAFTGIKVTLDELYASNDVLAIEAVGETVKANDAFVVNPVIGKFETDYAVSFTTITAMHMDMVSQLRKLKVAELTHAERFKLKTKLAHFWLRENDDIDPEDRRPASELLAEWSAE